MHTTKVPYICHNNTNAVKNSTVIPNEGVMCAHRLVDARFSLLNTLMVVGGTSVWE